jgi:hypothetical protein
VGNERGIRHSGELYAGDSDADVLSQEDDRDERAGLGSVERWARLRSPHQDGEAQETD